jgi:hypothetical protein
LRKPRLYQSCSAEEEEEEEEEEEDVLGGMTIVTDLYSSL